MVRPRSGKGYITLITVMIVGAIAATTAVSLLLLGTGASQGATLMTQSYQAQALADTCAEIALERLALSPDDTSQGSLALDDGDCTFAITSQTAADGQTDERQIESAGMAGEATRRVKALVDLINASSTVIVSWQEVADF